MGISLSVDQDSSESKVMDLILMGEYEILSENYKEATEYFLKALEQDSNSISIYLSLAELSVMDDNFENCVNYLNKAFLLDTNSIDIGLKSFDMNLAINLYEDAETIIHSLSRQYPNNVSIQNSMLSFYHSSKQWNDLINYYCTNFSLDTTQKKFLQQAVEIGLSTGNEDSLLEQLSSLMDKFPSNTFIISVYVQVSFQQQLYDLTTEGLTKLIQLSNDNFGIKLQLAEVYLLLDQPGKSIEILDELYYDNLDNQLLLNLLTITLSELEDYNRLAEISEHYIKIYPDSTDGYENLTIAYMNLKKYQDLLDISSLGEIKFPDNITFSYFMGNTYLTLEDFESAKREFLKSLEISPENRVIRQSLLTVFEELEEYKSSDSLFKILYSEDENDATNLNNYAYSLSDREIIIETTLTYALGLATKAIGLDPENSAFLDTIGWIHYKKENYGLALDYIKQSLSIDSTNSVILEHLGDVYIKLNDFEKGLNYYHKVMILTTGNQSVLNKIEQYK